MFIAALFFTISFSHAQVVGTGEPITKTYDVEEFFAVNVNINYDISLDMDAPAGITISAQANIIDLIGKEIKDGILTIDQVEWIEATQPISITIGAPRLTEIYTDSHSTVSVGNMTGPEFKVEATLGKVILVGSIAELRVINESSTVDASKLRAERASVSVNEDGTVLLNVSGEVACTISEDGRVKNINANGKMSNDCGAVVEDDQIIDEVKYIDLKIKNNSWSRRHFVVVGPKPDGGRFSYGFPMMPGAVKTERWTTGTKVYLESKVGKRNLLIELTSESAGETVDLFE